MDIAAREYGYTIRSALLADTSPGSSGRAVGPALPSLMLAGVIATSSINAVYTDMRRLCVPQTSSGLIWKQFRLSCLYDCADPASVCDAHLAVHVEGSA